MDVDWSRPIWRKDGQNEILGLPMSQNGFVVPFLSELARIVEPWTIVEIGTGAGGLTAILSALAEIVTFDVKEPEYNFESPYRDDISFVRGDVFTTHSGSVIDAIQGASGLRVGRPLWLLCDGGDKNREVETFAPFLKSGDIIAAHDYCPDRSTWNWHEVDEARVEAVAERVGLEVIPELQYDRKAAWWVRRKR